MLQFRRKSCHDFLQTARYSVTVKSAELKNGKKFQQTIFLPKTNFPSHLKCNSVAERDQGIQKECQFLDFYNWQRKHLKGKEFIIHDGPPYANGKPHIGHAINKIMKDVILRSQIIQGRRVHFIPGWDCHGLPIELVALKGLKNRISAIEIRQKAKQVASSMSEVQKNAFKNWGVLGDWTNQCYYTFDSKYIVNQLNMFWNLYEKGLIYYAVKPVYWSSSSRTALAEAELVYKDHISKSLIVRFETVQDSTSESMYLLIWTTTPWTLPFNKGVSYSDKIKYSAVKIAGYSGLYIMATELIEDFKNKLQREISIDFDVTCDMMSKLHYKHPWNRDQVMRVYEGQHVTLSGTGLVHLAPAHGHDDFIIGLKHNLNVECFVDEKGCYTSEMGSRLAGLKVLEEGSNCVKQHISSDIMLAEDYKHNYPYDWRTDKPVIIRASNQWFIDTHELKEKVIENLKNVEIPQKHFQTTIAERPYWCLSRQRTWGVPIPVFFHKTSNRPLLSKNLINHLSQMFAKSGADIWWTAKLEELFPDEVCRQLFVRREDVIKGEDIMDIWFDSGISWSYALNGKKSDVYLEGCDQYSGWFQSSLWTSTAVGNGAPFKRILTHGFAVDEKGKKMSKSLGNVIDPDTVLNGQNALGVDTLRWWAACHGHHTLVPVSQGILKTNSLVIDKLRKTLKYLLGALDGVTEEDLLVSKLQTLDVYLLNTCHKFYNSVINSYNEYDIYKVCAQILFFVPNEISGRYIMSIKDRLYCEERHSPSRKACIYTINGILETLCHSIAPILPHLAEEVFLYHPVYGGRRKLFYTQNPWTPPESWKNDTADAVVNFLFGIRDEILMVDKKISSLSCVLEVNEPHFGWLKNMQHGEEESIDSEITDILQVARVTLKLGKNKNVTVLPSSSSQCLRCKRYTAIDNKELCARCEAIVFKTVSFFNSKNFCPKNLFGI